MRSAANSSRRNRSGGRRKRSCFDASRWGSHQALSLRGQGPGASWPPAITASLLQVRQQELLLKLLQQQQAVAAVPTPPAPSSPPPLWAGLAKQGLSMKTLLELQLEGERQMHKQPPPREPSRAQAPNHRVVSRLGPAPVRWHLWGAWEPLPVSS